MVPSLNHLCWSTLASLQGVHLHLLMRSPKLCPELQECINRAEQRAMTISLNLLAVFLLMQSQMLLIFFDTRACWWLMVSLLSARIARPHPSSCFLISWPTASSVGSYSSLCVGLGISICWTSWSSFWSTPSAWWDLFEQWYNHSFSLPENLLRVHSIPPSRLFMKVLNKSSPSTKSCGTLLEIGH